MTFVKCLHVAEYTIISCCHIKLFPFQIKFLKTKEGTAMVQMGDGVSVERCVQNLNNVTVGDYTLTLASVSHSLSLHTLFFIYSFNTRLHFVLVSHSFTDYTLTLATVSRSLPYCSRTLESASRSLTIRLHFCQCVIHFLITFASVFGSLFY